MADAASVRRLLMSSKSDLQIRHGTDEFAKPGISQKAAGYWLNAT